MNSKQNKFALIFTFIAIGLLLATCVGTCVSSDSNTDGIDSTHIQVVAKIKAEDAVRSLLKSPSSADFQVSNQNFWLLPDSTVVVKGTVDADNSFGVKIRNNYYVKLKWELNENSDEIWSILDINLE